MVDFWILHRRVHFSAVGDLLVFAEFEGVLVQNHIAALIENFQKSSFIIGVCILRELCICQEILTVDTEIGDDAWCHCSKVNRIFGCLHSTSQTRLLIIDREQIDASILIFPKPTEIALHITAGHAVESHVRNHLVSHLHSVHFVIICLVESPCVLDTFRRSGFCKACVFALQELSHYF